MFENSIYLDPSQRIRLSGDGLEPGAPGNAFIIDASNDSGASRITSATGKIASVMGKITSTTGSSDEKGSHFTSTMGIIGTNSGVVASAMGKITFWIGLKNSERRLLTIL